MRNIEPFAELTAFLVVALATLGATAFLIRASWLAVLADCPPGSAPVDRTYWLAFLCVVAGAAATVWAARRLRDAGRTGREDEPVLWI